MMRHWLPALLILLSVLTGRAQQQKQAQDSPPTFSVTVNLVKVPFSVFDERGGMVQNLRPEDFQLYEDSVPQKIRSFGLEINPVSVVLLLDTSATVKQELKQIKKAAEEFANALSRDDRISIVTFADEVNLLLDWTGNTSLARKSLRKVKPGLRTALYDAMYAAAQDMLRDVEGRKAIILLTDCLNNQSSLGFHDAALSIVESQAALYVVSKTMMVRAEAKKERRVVMLSDIFKRMFGDADYIEEFFQKREAEMKDLAEKTGGRCFFPVDYDQIKDVYGEVARELKSKYYLTYVSNQNKAPNSYHRIAIDYLPSYGKLTHRQGYFYEPAPIPVRPVLRRPIEKN
jgi:Ca-activated chloride channel homolog